MKTTGLTAQEAREALPGQNINKVCDVYTAPTGRAQPLYDLREAPKAAAAPEEPAPKKRGRPKKVQSEEGDNVQEG